MDVRKVCILGDFAVGKTAIFTRYLYGRFPDRYHASIGVKVDLKEIALSARRSCKLAVWDVPAANTPNELFLRYVRGASGYLLVIDGTRAETLDRSLELREAVETHLAVLPFVGLINKADLVDRQEIDPQRFAQLQQGDGIWLRGSAIEETNLEHSFDLLLEAMEAQT